MAHALRRFFTREDRFHLHKALGAACLAHFMYRFYYMFTTGTGRFAPASPYTPILLAAHAGLSATGLFFHVPSNRIAKRPMIYREFRLHSIAFAYRSILAMLATWLEEAAILGPRGGAIARSLIALGTLVAADVVTHMYKAQDTTMRDMPFSDHTPRWLIRHLNMFYSFSQVLATLNSTYHPSMDAAFLVLFPIQFAAFLMTCVRKGVLGADGWHTLYAGALLLNYLHPTMFPGRSHPRPREYFWAIAALFSILRFRYRVNKYALWVPILAFFAAR